MATKQRLAQALCVVAFLASSSSGFSDDSGIERELDLIREQNRILQQQIKSLADKVSVLESAQDDASGRNYSSNDKTNRAAFPKVKIGVDGGLGWYISSLNQSAPFFVDDIRLSLDARLSEHISAYAELQLNYGNTENALNYGGHDPVFLSFYPYSQSSIQLNQIYLDFINLLPQSGWEHALNVRAGQFFIPFGEDYERRYPFDNPLVWRSVTDIWGVAPGLELYGSFGKWSYVVAAQNRSQNLNGFSSADKSVAGRIRFQPCEHWSFSASAMRTGDLLPGEQSAVWFNGYQFGGPFPYYFPIEGVTHNELYQLDARFNWDTGHLLGWGGFLHRSADYIVFDNPPYPQKGYADYWYYNLELLQYLTARLYAVGRAGEILDPYYPVNPLRLSLGVGYRFNDYAILKTDFTYDQGTAGYGTFAHAFATELAFRF